MPLCLSLDTSVPLLLLLLASHLLLAGTEMGLLLSFHVLFLGFFFPHPGCWFMSAPVTSARSRRNRGDVSHLYLLTGVPTLSWAFQSYLEEVI